MKNLVSLFLLLTLNLHSQSDMRGPMNMGTSPGVVDGVVVSNEVPIRSKIPYEHVRLADYVWSKRAFSRIDSRETINHELHDFFWWLTEYNSFIFTKSIYIFHYFVISYHFFNRFRVRP